ncbi:MAG: hypothetical protein ABFS03_03930 [Chloroflexota bacterium]
MAGKLQGIQEGDVKRLMIALPPRHTKSLMCSELFPAWWLAHNPDKQIIHASYAAALSNGFSLKVRALIRDNPVYRRLFPHIALSPDRQRLDDWKLISGGGFKSIGVGGGVTGHGADLFIIDDPHKEGDEQSATALQSVWDWYNSAARTRLSPGASILFPMTRWHPRDLAGRNLELAEFDKDADQWELVRLPALAEENDPLGREVGAALWPERFSKKNLLAIRAISERYFEALFQQNPSVTNEPLFGLGDFHRRENPLSVSTPFWTFDLASSDKERSDYTVAGKWSHSGNVLILHRVVRFRRQWPAVRRWLLDLAREEHESVFYFPNHSLELLALQMLRKEVGERTDVRFKAVEQPGDKVERAGVLSDFAKNGTVVVAAGKDEDAFVNEHCNFPDATDHDDCVDMSSVATHAVGLQKRFSMSFVDLPVRSGRKDAF